MIDRDEAVRLRAYQIWERIGQPDGEQESHWHQALKELGLAPPTDMPAGSTLSDEAGDGDNTGAASSPSGKSADAATIRHDAKGQFAPSQADSHSDGVANAMATSVTGEDDATLHKADEKPAPNPGFDERTQTNKRG